MHKSNMAEWSTLKHIMHPNVGIFVMWLVIVVLGDRFVLSHTGVYMRGENVHAQGIRVRFWS